MTYREFRDTAEYKLPWLWYILTITRKDEEKAIVAQWEPGNYKWYVPLSYEGREETGCYDDIWFPSERGNWKIVEMRPI